MISSTSPLESLNMDNDHCNYVYCFKYSQTCFIFTIPDFMVSSLKHFQESQWKFGNSGELYMIWNDVGCLFCYNHLRFSAFKTILNSHTIKDKKIRKSDADRETSIVITKIESFPWFNQKTTCSLSSKKKWNVLVPQSRPWKKDVDFPDLQEPNQMSNCSFYTFIGTEHTYQETSKQ